MDDNVFVTESTFDEQEMAITFVSVEENEKGETSTQQSRPESYLKAVMDYHSSSNTSEDQEKMCSLNNLCSKDGDSNSSSSSNNCHANDHEDDETCKTTGGLSRRDCGIEERSAGRAGASRSSPENLDLSNFNQVISELKDDGGRNLRKTSPYKNEYRDERQHSTYLSPLVKTVNVDVEVDIDSVHLEEAALDPKLESNNNINAFFPNKDGKEILTKRNDSLNSPFQVTPAYSEFRNGLRSLDKTRDCLELTDL